jgi:hypothetical protein
MPLLGAERIHDSTPNREAEDEFQPDSTRLFHRHPYSISILFFFEGFV